MKVGDLIRLPQDQGHGFGIVFKIISDLTVPIVEDVIELGKTVVVLVDGDLDYYDASSCEVISESW